MSLKKVGIRFFPRGPIILSETQKRSSCTTEKWSNYRYNPEMSYIANKLASSKLRYKVATRNYNPLTNLLSRVKCRATSVAKKGDGASTSI